PAAVVVEHDDRQVQTELPGGDEAADVVGQRDVADEQDDGVVAGGRHPERGGDGAVDAVGPAVGEDPGPAPPSGPGGEVQLDVADGHRGGDDERGLRGQVLGQQPGGERLRQDGGAQAVGQ